MASLNRSTSLAEKKIEEQLQKQHVRVITNVKQLYLADGNYEAIPDLHRFRYLTHLYAGGNRLRRADFLNGNFYLSHLYLNNNSLSNLAGAIEHLGALKVLHLHSNELENLERVLWTFRKMQLLESLTLFGNQCSQESDYLARVIMAVPSLKNLDFHLIQDYERRSAIRALTSDRTKEDASASRTAFLREVTADFGNNLYKTCPPFASIEDAAAARQQRKATIQYTAFDWVSVPTQVDRRANGKLDFNTPNAVTYTMKM